MAKKSGFFRRGSAYRKALEQIDVRIAVSGTRGKSSTVRRLHDIFHERGYDTFAKITGDEPFTLHNGEKEPIRRTGPEVTLYENHRLITGAVDRLASIDAAQDNVAIFENHAITEYTMRVFNETFFQPDVIVVPNLRTDHSDTLGRTRQDITRAFARSIPAGTHVISGEVNDAIHDYFTAELQSRDVTISRVSVPDRYRDLPGAESIYAIDEVLQAVGESPLPNGRVESLLESLRPSWTTLRDGRRVFNAAKVNEPESTELFRRMLAGDGSEAELICPFVFLRADRRGRSAKFVEYINELYTQGHIDRLHVAGENARTFARRVDPPATVQNSERESPASVIDAVLAEGQPVMIMGNTVHPFMRALVAELNDRTETRVERFADADPAPISTSGDSAVAAANDAGNQTDADDQVKEATPDATLEVYLDRADDWRWRLIHDNGNIIADGTRGRSSEDVVRTALDRVKGLAVEASVVEVNGVEKPAEGIENSDGPRFEVYQDRAEEWRWRLRDADGSILADSGEGYVSKGNALRGLTSVRRTIPASTVELKP